MEKSKQSVIEICRGPFIFQSTIQLWRFYVIIDTDTCENVLLAAAEPCMADMMTYPELENSAR